MKDRYTKPVGAGLPAMKECQSTFVCLIHRIRGQARSHKDCVEPTGSDRRRSVYAVEHQPVKVMHQMLAFITALGIDHVAALVVAK